VTPFDLSGRVALVTGASRGLGASMARALARAGAHVALHASRLTIPHPRTGLAMTFEAPLPADLKAVLSSSRAE